MKITRVGLDIAKQVFEAHGVNEYGVVKSRRPCRAKGCRSTSRWTSGKPSRASGLDDLHGGDGRLAKVAPHDLRDAEQCQDHPEENPSPLADHEAHPECQIQTLQYPDRAHRYHRQPNQAADNPHDGVECAHGHPRCSSASAIVRLYRLDVQIGSLQTSVTDGSGEGKVASGAANWTTRHGAYQPNCFGGQSHVGDRLVLGSATALSASSPGSRGSARTSHRRLSDRVSHIDTRRANYSETARASRH